MFSIPQNRFVSYASTNVHTISSHTRRMRVSPEDQRYCPIEPPWQISCSVVYNSIAKETSLILISSLRYRYPPDIALLVVARRVPRQPLGRVDWQTEEQWRVLLRTRAWDTPSPRAAFQACIYAEAIESNDARDQDFNIGKRSYSKIGVPDKTWKNRLPYLEPSFLPLKDIFLYTVRV